MDRCCHDHKAIFTVRPVLYVAEQENAEAVRGLRLGRTSLDEDDITILDDVILTLGHDFALRLDTGFIALFPQHAVVVYDDLDEGLLKVTVDDTGSLRCLSAVS
jgi:hypothetical protein